VLFTAIRAYALVVLLVYVFQDKLLYFPRDHAFTDCPQAAADGFAALETDFHKTHLRMFRKFNPTAKGWLLLFHGNGGSACQSLFYAEGMGSLPLSIALVEYPGYEEDGLRPGQTSMLENALAAYEYVRTQEVPPLPIVLYGQSLGTGVATYVASVTKPKALILESPYTATVDIGADRYPFLPVSWLMRNRYPASEWAAKVQAPVLAFHGTADTTIPFGFGEAQSHNFKNLVKFVAIAGAGHNDLPQVDPGRFWGEITSFVLGLFPNTYE
jgi:fermentation-respiration switch protein FrsA (DUF1100 family)